MFQIFTQVLFKTYQTCQILDFIHQFLHKSHMSIAQVILFQGHTRLFMA